jgi:peptide/nickel transport system permease protein
MLQYVIRRLLLSIPVFIGISIVSFFLVHLSGDPTDLVMPIDATEEARFAFRHKHGLDKPLWVQYYRFCFNIARGDFGTSLRFDQPAGRLVAERLAATAQLALTSLSLAVVFGVPAGVIAAYRPRGFVDAVVRSFSLVGQAVPNFYLGLLLIIIFSQGMRLLPSGGIGSWKHLVLPAISLAAYMTALLARVTRSTMLDILRHDYIRTARAMGFNEVSVVIGHGVRNALIPIVTVIALMAGFLMGGVVVIETVFSWPGIGRLAVQSIYARDFPVVQAIVFLSATVFVLINLIVDILYGVFDPRISYK